MELDKIPSANELYAQVPERCKRCPDVRVAVHNYEIELQTTEALRDKGGEGAIEAAEAAETIRHLLLLRLGKCAGLMTGIVGNPKAQAIVEACGARMDREESCYPDAILGLARVSLANEQE